MATIPSTINSVAIEFKATVKKSVDQKIVTAQRYNKELANIEQHLLLRVSMAGVTQHPL